MQNWIPKSSKKIFTPVKKQPFFTLNPYFFTNVTFFFHYLLIFTFKKNVFSLFFPRVLFFKKMIFISKKNLFIAFL